MMVENNKKRVGMKVGINDNDKITCKYCHETKSARFFAINGNGYYEHTCSLCRAKLAKNAYHEIRKHNTPKYWEIRFRSLKQGAKKRGLPFEITPIDLFLQMRKQNDRCWYTDQKMFQPSVDRIDNNRGYTVDNIIICEFVVNVMRRAMTQEKFVSLCRKIADTTEYKLKAYNLEKIRNSMGSL